MAVLLLIQILASYSIHLETGKYPLPQICSYDMLEKCWSNFVASCRLYPMTAKVVLWPKN